MASPLTDAQLREELRRCQTCEARPCRRACPAGLSPADFILAVRCGEPSDYARAAAHILGHNPLGGVCGAVCPGTLCMARCARRAFDGPVNIPAIQAGIVDRARRLGVLPRPEPVAATGDRVAVVGAGPAGLGAATVLARAGHAVHVLDRARRPGGMIRLIPRHRLDPDVLDADLAWLLGVGDISLLLGRPVPLPRELLARGYAAVVVAAGLGDPVPLDVPGGRRALPWTALLGEEAPDLAGRRVGVVGDGAVAVDCALAALARGAAHVELLALRKLSELALPRAERDRLFESGVHLSGRVRVTALRGRGARVTAVVLRRVELPPGQAYHPSRLVDLPSGEHERRDLDVVVAALGGRPGLRREPHPRVVHAGDLEAGPTTVVEALASGKRAGEDVNRLLGGADAACPDRASCADGSGCPKRATCPEWSRPASPGSGSGAPRAAPGLPVPLDADVLGRRVSSPFLLAAGPYAAGHAPLRRAYDAGWGGAVMGVPRGGGERALDAACRDVERVVREFPQRLTMVRHEGPPASPDATAGWLAQARRLEAAGAMVLEVEACGPEAIDAVLGAGLRIPALFRLPGGVPATDDLLAGVAAALARHPRARAGVTLADPRFADPARHGLFAAADAGPMTYRAAATLLARGARAVQVSSAVTRLGLGVVRELHAGLSWWLAGRGLASVAALVGTEASAAGGAGRAAGPEAGVSALDPARCTACGNCARCAYEAIALDARGLPAVDPARCTGCGTCVAACFAGALRLSSRTVK